MLKDAAVEEDTALAFKAFNPDISAQPYYLPLIATTGVLLLEANHIAQLYWHDHFNTPAPPFSLSPPHPLPQPVLSERGLTHSPGAKVQR